METEFTLQKTGLKRVKSAVVEWTNELNITFILFTFSILINESFRFNILVILVIYNTKKKKMIFRYFYFIFYNFIF